MKEVEDCFEVDPGTPTLTVILNESARMIPYHSFIGATREQSSIRIEFDRWELEIEGANLASLWRALQLQEVRWLQVATAEMAEELEGDCVIRISP